MDLGDWQELSRLRFENHAWHLCIDAILQVIDGPHPSTASITEAVDRSVNTLNDRLVRIRRRPISLRPH